MMVPMHLLAPFLNSVEGVKYKSYDDATGKTLKEGDTAIGTVTIFNGLTTWEDGSPILPGSEISVQRGMDLFFDYIKRVLTPSLGRLLRPDVYAAMNDNQKAAFASFVFNLGETKARGYTLTKMINEGASDEALARQWMKYHFAGGKPMLGLYRRRIGEVLLWHGLDWRIWPNVSYENDVIDVMTQMGWDGEPEPEVATWDGYADPTPEDGRITTADANAISLMKVNGVPRQTVEVPNLDVTKPPKLIEESTTFRGLSKADSGKESIKTSVVLGSAAAAVPTVNAVTGYLERYSTSAIIGTMLLFAGALLAVGIWRWWRGQIIAYEGRQEATQPKA